MVLVVVACAGVGALMYRLAQGPISITALNDKLATELGSRLGHGYKVELGASAFERVGGILTVSLAGLSVKDRDDRAVFMAPRASVAISLPPLLFGLVKPTRVDLFDVEMGLTITPEGSLAVSAGTEPATADIARTPSQARIFDPIAKAVADVLNTLSDGSSPISNMEWVGIRGGRLTFDDKAGGRVVDFNDVELGFLRHGATSDLTLAATGPSGPWEAHARAGKFEGSDRAFEVELRDVTFDEVALLAGLRAP
jgi:hypothetical protein